MVNNLSYLLYKAVINCFFFEFTVYSRTCNTQFIHDTCDGNTAVFNSFLKDFALMWHIVCIA